MSDALSDVPQILSYATPLDRTAAPGEVSVTFSPPPIRQEIFVNTLGLIVSGFGSFVLIAIPTIGLQDHRLGQLMPGVVLCLGMATVIAIFGWSRWIELRRLRRYDGSPVRIEVHGSDLELCDPLQWGSRVRTVSLAQIRRCYASSEGAGFVARSYHIDFRIARARPIRIRVASHEGGVVERVVTDLKAAIAAAKASAPRVQSEESGAAA